MVKFCLLVVGALLLVALGVSTKMQTQVERIFKRGNFQVKCNQTEASSKQGLLQSKETNAPNFVRLVVMRLIYGIFSLMGWEESLSGFLGGVFVPPGADDYSDYGDDLSDIFT